MIKKSPKQNELNNLIQKINMGDFCGAETEATSLVKNYPKATLVWKILGVAIAEQGKMEEAIAPMKKVVTLDPKDAEAHRNLATALKEIDQIETAEIYFRKAIALNSQDLLSYISLAKILNEKLSFSDAEKVSRKAIMINYDTPEAHDQLGIALLGKKKFIDAESCFRSAILLKPDMVDAHNNLGIALNEQARYAEAESSYIQALKLNPVFINSFINIAKNFSDERRYIEAENAYRKVLVIEPDHIASLACLGLILYYQRKEEEAKTVLEQVLALDPQLPGALNTLGNVHKELGNTEIALECYRKAINMQPDLSYIHSNLLLTAGYHAKSSPEQLLQEAKKFGQYVSSQVKKPYKNWLCHPPGKNEKLRIGLISGDFRRHSVIYFLENLLINFNKEKFELIAYFTDAKEDDVSVRIKSHFIKWHHIHGNNDQESAAIIHQDAPHVLVDLSGHTASNRLPVLAYKPAPIQATWLGYPATTGMTEIDYILGDPYMTPPCDDHLYVEKVWRLPEITWSFDPLMEEISIAELAALKNQYITFGCFNNLSKINDNVVKVWSDILHAIPTAKLYLQTSQLNKQSVVQKTYDRFSACGISMDRLILEAAGTRENYFRSFNKVDIALDPFPCPGGTTSADTLWMSVPILTMKGQSYWSRIGESIVHNIGLDDWIATDTQSYIQKAIEFSSDISALAKLKASLRGQVMASPLFNSSRFTRNFEAALTEMVAIHYTEK